MLEIVTKLCFLSPLQPCPQGRYYNTTINSRSRTCRSGTPTQLVAWPAKMSHLASTTVQLPQSSNRISSRLPGSYLRKYPENWHLRIILHLDLLDKTRRTSRSDLIQMNSTGSLLIVPGRQGLGAHDLSWRAAVPTSRNLRRSLRISELWPEVSSNLQNCWKCGSVHAECPWFARMSGGKPSSFLPMTANRRLSQYCETNCWDFKIHTTKCVRIGDKQPFFRNELHWYNLV